MREGSVSAVKVLMSPMTSCNSPGGAPSRNDDAISTVEDILVVTFTLVM